MSHSCREHHWRAVRLYVRVLYVQLSVQGTSESMVALSLSGRGVQDVLFLPSVLTTTVNSPLTDSPNSDQSLYDVRHTVTVSPVLYFNTS